MLDNHFLSEKMSRAKSVLLSHRGRGSYHLNGQRQELRQHCHGIGDVDDLHVSPFGKSKTCSIVQFQEDSGLLLHTHRLTIASLPSHT